jgi:hypothetical protein
MSVTLDCKRAPFVLQKKINYVLAVAILAAKKSKEAMLAPVVGLSESRFGGRFCIGAFSKNHRPDYGASTHL